MSDVAKYNWWTIHRGNDIDILISENDTPELPEGWTLGQQMKMKDGAMVATLDKAWSTGEDKDEQIARLIRERDEARAKAIDEAAARVDALRIPPDAEAVATSASYAAAYNGGLHDAARAIRELERKPE